jgi:hypothetical protein
MAVCSPPSGATFNLGTTTVTCTATDTSGNTAICSFIVRVFDICIQNDSNPATVLFINSMTGAYQFCCNGLAYIGVGSVTQKGSLLTLEHNGSTVRVHARVDKAVNTATGSIQQPPGTSKCSINDRNIANNSCDCTAPPAP